MGKKSKKKQDTTITKQDEQPENAPSNGDENVSRSAEPTQPHESDDDEVSVSDRKPSSPLEPAQKPEGDASLNQEIGKLRAQLEAVENERDDIQDQYEELLDKVSHIKTTLGQRLKSDAAELSRVKEEMESLKAENTLLSSSIQALEKQKAQAESKYEKDHAQLSYVELQLSEEQEKVKNLESKVAQLTEDVDEQSNYAEHYRKSHQEASSTAQKLEKELTSKIDQQAVQIAESEALAEASTNENRDLISQIETLKSELETHAQKAAGAEELNETIREKNILIGKLRHEAVILNEHLTNALRIVKKDSEGQTVDKDLVSNLIVQFVTIPRGDTKKFEVLQLIASFLNWDEDRRIEAGLSRSGQQGSERSLGGFLGKFAEFMERESRKS